MFETFRNIRKNMLTAAVGCMVLGLALLFFPNAFLNVACYVVGALLIAYGVICILGCVRDRWMRLGAILFGVIVAAVGIFMIANPRMISSIQPIVFGLILLMDGVVNVRHGIGLRRFGDPSGLSVLIMGVITVAFGAVILLYPYTTAAVTLRLMGVALLYSGLSDLIILFRLNRANRAYEEQQKVIDVEARPVDDEKEDR